MNREPLDYHTLAEDLTALAYPLRLQLLDILETPHILSDIRLSPLKLEPGADPQRPAAKQTVLAHLEKLVEAGLVKPSEVERLGKRLTCYATSPQRLYAVAEELRRLVVRHAGRGAGDDVTGTRLPGGAPTGQRGARLVLVHGAYEGRAYPLARERGEARIVGRSAASDVSLDYDPFVSSENSAFEENAQGWWVRDLASKNGTSVNWDRLPSGASRRIEHGDIIGVGRSLLVFYER